MSLVVTPPAVSTPMGKGVTSDSNKSCTVKNLYLLDCILHCSNIFHCFIRIDGPVLPAVEEL